MRKLSIGRRIKYDVVRELRTLRLWSESLNFPKAPWEGRGYYNWKLPMPRALVSPPAARVPVQAACIHVLISAAERLASQKLPGLEHARVFAIVSLPDLFSSEICIFFDPDYQASFHTRDSADERWTLKPNDSPIRRFSLSLPSDFEEWGFDTFYRDDTFDPPYIEEGETWLIGETSK